MECGLLAKHNAVAAVYALYQFLCLWIVLVEVVGIKIQIILKNMFEILSKIHFGKYILKTQ